MEDQIQHAENLVARREVTPEEIAEREENAKNLNKARLTVTDVVYYQHPEGAPLSLESRFTRLVEGDDEPYSRRCRVGEQWEPLDSGWIGKVGHLALRNDEGKFTQVIPTVEQREAAMKKVVELGVLVQPAPGIPIAIDLIVPVATIIVGESLRLTPTNFSALRVRSLSGVARLTIIVCPG